MGNAHDHEHEDPKDDRYDDVPGHTYRETRHVKPVRPQYDPAEIARKYLDDMEKGGRLHHSKKKR